MDLGQNVIIKIVHLLLQIICFGCVLGVGCGYTCGHSGKNCGCHFGTGWAYALSASIITMGLLM